jgi:hypothetical protein
MEDIEKETLNDCLKLDNLKCYSIKDFVTDPTFIDLSKA